MSIEYWSSVTVQRTM